MSISTNPIALDETLKETNKALAEIQKSIEKSQGSITDGAYLITDIQGEISEEDYIPFSTTKGASKKTLFSNLEEKFWKYVSSKLASVATSGDYADLTGVPALKAVATSGNYVDLNGRPSLATVATSGNYNDLKNNPEVLKDLRVNTTKVNASTAITFNSFSKQLISSSNAEYVVTPSSAQIIVGGFYLPYSSAKFIIPFGFTPLSESNRFPEFYAFNASSSTITINSGQPLAVLFYFYYYSY